MREDFKIEKFIKIEVLKTYQIGGIIMKDVLELIIASLVNNKEEIPIEETSNEKSIDFKVKVAEGDMGKVIGKQGRVAKSIRTVMKSIAGKQGKKVNVEFVEE